jgi:hypothetical protein
MTLAFGIRALQAFPLASANQNEGIEKNVACSQQHSASQFCARLPSASEAKRIYLQYRQQILLIPVEGNTIPER